MDPRSALFSEFAQVAAAVSHPHRLEILEQLAQGERSVEALASRTGLSVANTSQHLQQLKRSGLAASRRNGQFVIYSISDDSVIALLASLRLVAERRIAEVERIVRRYFKSRDTLEPVSRAELVSRMKAGLVTLLDVRPADEYAHGHIPGAINVPVKDIEVRLAGFDPRQEIVAYCRGPYCVLSFEAVAALRARGFKVRRLEDGLPEWRAAGLPVVSEAA